MRFISAQDTAGPWDLVVAGSGFGALFFLKRYLELEPTSKVLILEWGRYNTTEWQIENRDNSDIKTETTYVNQSPKEWKYTIGLGGSSNCWWAQTPRLHPTDFSLKTRHGVGVDWPLSYDDLIPYYQQVERIMMVAGPDDLNGEFPGTDPYPQPPHRMSTIDQMLRSRPGHKHFVVPNARLSVPVNGRGKCCASAVCHICPTGAKFTAFNSLDDVLSHPNVSICTSARVRSLETRGGLVTGAMFTHGEREYQVAGDLFVLGANAIHNPWILMKSGIGGHGVGRYLGEKMYALTDVMLDRHAHFDGGTATTCFNLSRVDGPSRSEMGTVVYYLDNMPAAYGLRMTKGRWREVLHVSTYVEDLLLESNGIVDEGGDLPVIRHAGYSEYAHKGLAAAIAALPDILQGLPIESINLRTVWPTMGHVQGTTRMGMTRADSVVDADLRHHDHRNLLVVGTSVFPTTGSVNVTLTACALSMRAAEKLVASA